MHYIEPIRYMYASIRNGTDHLTYNKRQIQFSFSSYIPVYLYLFIFIHHELTNSISFKLNVYSINFYEKNK